MKYFLVIVAIICMALLFATAQEEVVPEEELVQPVVLPATRLSVTLIDELNDQLIKMENCVVQVLGELHIVEDSFNYSNTFVEGDRYEMTIHIKLKK